MSEAHRGDLVLTNLPEEDSSYPTYEILVKSSQFPDKRWFYHNNHCHEFEPIDTLAKAFRAAVTETQTILDSCTVSDCQCQVTDLATGSVRLISISRKNTRS